MTQQVAQTILAQLGGNRFAAMTGSKPMTYSENSLTLSIGRGAKNGINRLVVKLDDSDTYTVQFATARGINWTVKHEISGVYCDMLQEIFTEQTGFLTKM